MIDKLLLYGTEQSLEFIIEQMFIFTQNVQPGEDSNQQTTKVAYLELLSLLPTRPTVITNNAFSSFSHMHSCTSLFEHARKCNFWH